MSPEPFVSRAKVPPAERGEKGYGDENGSRHLENNLASENWREDKTALGTEIGY